MAVPKPIDKDQVKGDIPLTQADYLRHQNDPVYQDIMAARVKMLFEMPFFGNLAVRLKLVDASGWCSTAATDGRYLYYNREFIMSLTKPQLLFLIAHEVLHVVYDHFGRRQGRDPKLWNMANDYIVNYTLVNERIGQMPEMGLYDKRYTDEMASEEVYELLKKNSVTIKMPLDVHLELGNDNEDGEGQGKSPGEGQGTVSVTVHGKDGPPKLTEEDLQRIRAEVKAAVIQSAQQVGAGNVPAGVRRMIDELVNPKLDWRTLLDAHIRSSIKDDYAMHRLSRRTMALRYTYRDRQISGRAPILPAQDNMDTVEVACCIDTSGSMTNEMLRDFLSEVKGIMQTFREFKLSLWTFDTQVYEYREYTGQNIDEIDEYPMCGGGGTMFECNWEFMKREGHEPARLVVFTDGYPCGTWGEPDYCDTIFVVHGNTSIVAPFGITAYYEK